MECNAMDLIALEAFVVEAKAAAYVGGGAALQSCRRGSHDVGYVAGRWRYLDSYFGGTDFSGQEVAWFDDEPIWAMTYFGTVLDPQRIDAHRAGAVIKTALADLYGRERRFLGGFQFEHEFGHYVDVNTGGCHRFTGREHILVGGLEAYVLHYQGGLVS
jgi:hypothetical protein